MLIGYHSYLGYTMVWNFLDCPALAMPVSRVNPLLDVKRPAHEFLNDSDRSVYELCMFFFPFICSRPINVFHIDEPETFEDAPIGFQIVGRKHEDEAVIAMAEIVDAALKAF